MTTKDKDFEIWWEKEGIKLPESFDPVANAFKEIAEKAWAASKQRIIDVMTDMIDDHDDKPNAIALLRQVRDTLENYKK